MWRLGWGVIGRSRTSGLPVKARLGTTATPTPAPTRALMKR
jgi:hypothetical protein